MKSNFGLANVVGTVYRQGNLVFARGGTVLYLPVGNRVSCFDLEHNTLFTFEHQHRRNIVCIALNRQGTLLVSVDESGRAILASVAARVAVHHFNLRGLVRAVEFSPDGRHLAVARDRFLQIWQTPQDAERQFAPFVRVREHGGHYGDIVLVQWSRDGRFVLTASADMTARVFLLAAHERDAAVALAGHRDGVVGAFFGANQESIHTVSRDGAVFVWRYADAWEIAERHYVHLDQVRVRCAHSTLRMLVLGLSNGEFRLYEMPGFAMVQQLSMGQHGVDTVTANALGEWLALGLRKAGQLLVYEWLLELYVLRQQGHFDTLNALCYTPDGLRVVTALDDGKLKVWDVRLGFCLCTFAEHSGGVSAVAFAKNVLFLALLDGTVRAWDLVRFRNFRVFTAPRRVQFSALAVDPSGEVVVAALEAEFDIFVWSVQTGALLDTLAGHEAPVLCLAFGLEQLVLALALWDKTLRVWNIFSRLQTVEPIDVEHDVLLLAVRPDSRELAASTLNGHVYFYSVELAQQTHHLDIRRDVFAGRHLDDRFELKNLARARSFTAIAYLPDGLSLLGAGNNNLICLYDVATEVLVRRFVVLENMALDGTWAQLNSANITDAGINSELIDTQGDASDREDRADSSLPGSHRGDPGMRTTRPQMRVTSVAFLPTLAQFAAATTDGLLIYSAELKVVFDPFELDMDVTPHAVEEALAHRNWAAALVMAFRLNDAGLLAKCTEAVPAKDIRLVCADLPAVYVGRLLRHLGENTRHMEFCLLWVRETLMRHGRYIGDRRGEFAPVLKLVQRFLARVGKDLVQVGKRSQYSLRYLTAERV